MKRDLQDKFFQIFEIGGVWDIARSLKSYHDGKIHINGECLNRWDKQFKADETRIEQFIDDFDDGILISPQMPLMREIEECLNELGNKNAQERHISSIIVRLSDIGNILYPNTSHTCSEEIIKDTLNQAFEYFEIYANPEGENARIEVKAISWCIFMLNQFINRLDALCLPYHIDIEKLQNDAGIRLRSLRLIEDIMYYVGSYDLTVKYLKEIGALPEDILPGKKSEHTAVSQADGRDKVKINQITAEQLKVYFSLNITRREYNVEFLNGVKVVETRFDKLLSDINSLSGAWNAKQTAALALFIYDNCLDSSLKSKKRKENLPFNKWSQIFANYCGKNTAFDKPNALRGYGSFLKTFDYLKE